jgi:hypothetical protein
MFDVITSSPMMTLTPLNGSDIVLIPKKVNASTPADYRLISIVHGVQSIFFKNPS